MELHSDVDSISTFTLDLLHNHTSKDPTRSDMLHVVHSYPVGSYTSFPNLFAKIIIFVKMLGTWVFSVFIAFDHCSILKGCVFVMSRESRLNSSLILLNSTTQITMSRVQEYSVAITFLCTFTVYY